MTHALTNKPVNARPNIAGMRHRRPNRAAVQPIAIAMGPSVKNPTNGISSGRACRPRTYRTMSEYSHGVTTHSHTKLKIHAIAIATSTNKTWCWTSDHTPVTIATITSRQYQKRERPCWYCSSRSPAIASVSGVGPKRCKIHEARNGGWDVLMLFLPEAAVRRARAVSRFVVVCGPVAHLWQ